ncbi:hypothetical protein AQPE_0437 [Aquipluma nitroreducens]|uniref:Endonuclease/exonuclease/phosphatase domain-containing protein n=1 Tax=Aquipluma nitroreducens TaxID=2010828 RepID=A0A5K7S497_9BACT|nr:hypothetical protein [Aquipluma nitroreducens]BBE16300.1 hypothetical protein AQPE_0437 [Aquipluma nitroreducens]
MKKVKKRLLISGFLVVVLLGFNHVLSSTLTQDRSHRIKKQAFTENTSDTLQICSFNNQFVGSFKNKKNELLSQVLKKFDVVVVQELVAPPVDGAYPDGSAYFADPEAKGFVDAMLGKGFKYVLSTEDTGTGERIHSNGTSTEWWICFYKPGKIELAPDLPNGFLAEDRSKNPDFDRVPYAFSLRSKNRSLDFVLIPVHLRPGEKSGDSPRRAHELQSIARWIENHSQKEKDFIILGDMNIYNKDELVAVTPVNFKSLNFECKNTTTLQPNEIKGKPYDHIMINRTFTWNEVDHNLGFKVINLIQACKPLWDENTPYPGEPYVHDEFRQHFSDHNPVYFQMIGTKDDD